MFKSLLGMSKIYQNIHISMKHRILILFVNDILVLSNGFRVFRTPIIQEILEDSIFYSQNEIYIDISIF